MAVHLSSALKRVLCYSSFRLQQSRHIGFTSPCLDEKMDGGEDFGEVSGAGEEGTESPSSSIHAGEEDDRVKPPPYAQELRKMMVAKYLSNQPTAWPHAFCEEVSDKLSLPQLRTQYKKKVAAARKQYIYELEQKRIAKAAKDKKLREEMILAKEERLRLKKEASAQRAIEVAEEKRLLQEQLAKERTGRRAYRKIKDKEVEERKQQKRDLIRQESGNWIEEKDLESRIVQAYLNPVEL